ncbi:hypothetical protein [Streptacidiphilus anmyonensis]|uniref:hypothetical protein n=1 Tax=Streptacidiphilus anmyonensis TaxID=405782 RepID=UPI0005A91BF3|nr:hypothetical protein [Streptacidiphilus anmyonensis]
MADETSSKAKQPPADAERERRADEARAYLHQTTGAEVTPAMERAGRALLERIADDTRRRATGSAPGGSAA